VEPFDLTTTDRLLSTTRALRKRLDLDRPVEREVLLDSVRLSQQAPTGSNSQAWRWVIVTDPDKRAALAELYRKGGGQYLATARERFTSGQTARVYASASWLADNLEKVPVHVIPCSGRLPDNSPLWFTAASMGSIFPAVWSFQLALRARGLGSVITSFHLAFEKEAAQLLSIPNDVMQVALLPVAYTKGTEFKPARRPPAEEIVHWDSWGHQLEPRAD
jgi:nitroreductase